MGNFIRYIGNIGINSHRVAAYEEGEDMVSLRHELNGKETGRCTSVSREFFDEELDHYVGVKVLQEALDLIPDSENGL